MMQKLRHHPDLGGDPSVAQQLNEALSILSDPVKRKRYDRQLKRLGSDNLTAQQNKPDSADEPTHAHTATKSQHSENDSDQPDTCQHNAGSNPHPEPDQTNNRTRADAAAALPGKPQCPFCHALHPVTPTDNRWYGQPDHCVRCGGAATSIQSLEQSYGEELRKIYRHSHTATVSLWTVWPLTVPTDAILTDLSVAGCAISCQSVIRPDTIVLIDTDALNAICIARYCQNMPQNRSMSIGFEFLTLHIKAQPGTMFSATV